MTGVSWFEAAAYAEFAGKSLPTIYHWTLAAAPWTARYHPSQQLFADRGPPAWEHTAG